MRNYYPLINSMGSGAAAVDSDAQAFITAAAITDSTQQSAINTLVIDLKGYGIWTKMKAIYPFVGGTASKHRFNLKTPTTNITDYYLTFVNGWTHSSSGITPNGTDAYANTNFNPIAISQSLSSTHLSVYTTSTNSTGTSRGYLGSIGTDATNYTALGFFNGGTLEIGVVGGSSTEYVGRVSGFSGFKLTTTNGSRNNSYFRNNAKIETFSQSSNFFNANMYLGAINYIGNPAYYQTVPFTFASIGDGLSDTEALNFYNAVQSFQVALGRNV